MSYYEQTKAAREAREARLEDNLLRKEDMGTGQSVLEIQRQEIDELTFRVKELEGTVNLLRQTVLTMASALEKLAKLTVGIPE